MHLHQLPARCRLCFLKSLLTMGLFMGFQVVTAVFLLTVVVLGVPDCHCQLPSHCGLVHGFKIVTVALFLSI
jgi:hypothetical protein